MEIQETKERPTRPVFLTRKKQTNKQQQQQQHNLSFKQVSNLSPFSLLLSFNFSSQGVLQKLL